MSLTLDEFNKLKAKAHKGTLTSQEKEALTPYKVDNAIIMAAGLSSRFAPISYEKPKGLLRVKGEILIERQIRQLQEAGITNICVVVGYKKEYFFYLQKKFGVTVVINPEYATKNNVSTLYHVRDQLKNSYICSSDDYFTQNPFEQYMYHAAYASVFVEGDTSEWCLTTDTHSRITDICVGGKNSWIMLGHVYFDTAFSRKLVAIIEDEYQLPQTDGKLWEDLFKEHVDELEMYLNPYDANIIHEFDSLDELREFDPDFMQNINLDIFDNIENTLGCKRQDIGDFYPLKKGITNLSCHFSVRTSQGVEEYVYRHPGVGTEKLIDRAAEFAALTLAKELGLDTTFIYENPREGWKISKFIPHAKPLDPHEPTQVKRAMQMAYTLHQSGAVCEKHFDFVEEGLRYEQLLVGARGEGIIQDIPGYTELKDKVLELKRLSSADGFATVFSHNDFFALNFLIADTTQKTQDKSLPQDTEDITYNLIDWEYAGMSDEANDFATFAVCSELSFDEIKQDLAFYYGRTPTDREFYHHIAVVVFAGWCWYIWALVKEAEGDNVGEWLFIYYRYAINYIDMALDWYRGHACI